MASNPLPPLKFIILHPNHKYYLSRLAVTFFYGCLLSAAVYPLFIKFNFLYNFRLFCVFKGFFVVFAPKF